MNLGNFEDTAPSNPADQLQDWGMDGEYDITSEAPPAHDFFKPAVSTGLAFADETIKRLQQQILRVRQQCPDAPGLAELEASTMIQLSAATRRLAVVGDSGQGKSSLINSLLHIPGIAQSGSSGEACTAVVVEYHQRKEGQTSPIDIAVEFYSGKALEELVGEMARTSRMYYLQKAKDTEQTLNESEKEESDLKQLQTESKAADDALQTAFKHHEGFSLDFLHDLSDGSHERVTTQLIDWARAIEWPTGGTTTTQDGPSVWQASAIDAYECTEKTRAFMGERLWPFTKVIRVYLQSPILETGLILADLPGFRDSNDARVQASQRYLLDCEQILVVAKIGRVITDLSVQGYLGNEHARLKTSQDQRAETEELRLTVVCTASDDIDERSPPAGLVGDGKEISKKAYDQLQADIRAAKVSRNRDKKEAAQQKLKYAVGAARERYITRRLKEVYKTRIPGARIDVFCVGNHDYWDICDDSGDAERIQATGIPALRQHCHSLTASARLANARYWIETAMPNLLQSVDSWAHSMLSNVDLGEMKLENIMSGLEQIRCETPAHVAKLLRDQLESFWADYMAIWPTNQDTWAESAIRATDEWNTWRYASYNAFLRHRGIHFTLKCLWRNWNEELSARMRWDLENPLNTLVERVETVQAELVKKLTDDLSRFVADKLEDVPAVEKEMLTETIDKRIQMLEHAMIEVVKSLTSSVTKIKIQTLISDHYSYLRNEMFRTYWNAWDDKGKGVLARQRAKIDQKLRSGTLFPNIAARMSADMEAAIKASEKSVNDLTTELMDSLVHEFQMVLSPSNLLTWSPSSVEDLKESVGDIRKGLANLQSF